MPYTKKGDVKLTINKRETDTFEVIVNATIRYYKFEQALMNMKAGLKFNAYCSLWGGDGGGGSDDHIWTFPRKILPQGPISGQEIVEWRETFSRDDLDEDNPIGGDKDELYAKVQVNIRNLKDCSRKSNEVTGYY